MEALSIAPVGGVLAGLAVRADWNFGGTPPFPLSWTQAICFEPFAVGLGLQSIHSKWVTDKIFISKELDPGTAFATLVCSFFPLLLIVRVWRGQIGTF
jgi:hypothetical protein